MTTTLLRGGRVLARNQTDATAMLVVDSSVAWVGGDDDSHRHADGANEVVDLDGALVTPAFVDSHAHLSQTGLALDGLDLSTAPSLAAALDALARHARTRDDAVLLGFSWDETAWPEGRPPTGAEVDAAVGDRVAYLSRVDGHSAITSATLVARAPSIAAADGWDGSGRVERAAHHAARDAIHGLITASQREAALRRALRHAASLGLACVHEISAPHINPPDDLAAIRRITAEEPLPVVIPYWGQLHAIDRALELGCVGNAGDLCADGSLGSRTASLAAPYADAPTSGHGYLTAAEITEHVVACTRAGLQAGFHAIGDAGVTATVDGMVEASRAVGVAAFVAARHRIEHLEMVTPEQATVLAALGVVGSVQPAFDAAWGGPGGMYAERLGAARAAAMNPYATLVEAGMTLAFGSDSPVTPLDPWGAVRAAVQHHEVSERLDADSALSAHTSGGWRAAKRDDVGELVPGAPATFAVWAAASLEGAVDRTPICTRTVADGRTVYEA